LYLRAQIFTIGLYKNECQNKLIVRFKIMNKMEYKGYCGSTEYSEADACWCGIVLDMPHDLISYEGNTIAELEADFKAGVDSYLEGCAEMGIVPRKSYGGKTVTNKTKEKVLEYA
jgi:predicted HicB family RNase H-like nuclease